MTADGASGGPALDLDYCLDLVRSGDRDRYLTILLAPPGLRAALAAVYAFKHEVEKTHALVSEPMLGQIRLQWWRESLEGAFAGTPRRHAVVTPLAAAVARFSLPRAPFERIVDGHERDLDLAPFATMDDLRAYCADVEGSVIALAIALSHDVDEDARNLARETGIGFGVSRLLRRLGANLRSGPLAIPADLAAAHGIDPAALRQLGPGDARLKDAVDAVAEAAHGHLRQARRNMRSGRGRERIALLHAMLGQGVLTRLRRADYNPFDQRVSEPAAGESWRLLAAHLVGRAVLRH